MQRLPQRSGLAEAIRYALLAGALTIRPVTLGRKSHLLAGSDGGAGRWATISSLITSAKPNDVESRAWITDVLRG